MRYEGRIYRPPSEADAYILQATIGCSWNHCTYCDMYRDKEFRVRELAETLEDLDAAAEAAGGQIEKLFVADGDALIMDMDHWRPILERAKARLPRLRRVSCYAMARNVAAKSDDELKELAELGLTRLYIGPESGDDVTLKSIAKGAGYADHVEAASRARRAGMKQSAIFLLGAGGAERSVEHATASARLATAMDPEFLSVLTLTIIDSTTIHKLAASNRFRMPTVECLMGELRIIVAEANPGDTIFRSNHASNYLPIGGRLPRDRDAILELIDTALSGDVPLRVESSRGL